MPEEKIEEYTDAEESSRTKEALLHMLTSLSKVKKETEAVKNYIGNIIKSMPNSLVVVDPDAKIKTINKATTDLLGYTEDELVGHPVTIIFEEEEAPFKGAKMKERLKEGSVRDCNLTYKTKIGKKIPVSFSGSVMQNKKGEVIGIVGIAKDMREINRLLQTEKELVAETVAAAAEKKRVEDLLVKINERKEAEEALKESEARFRNIVARNVDAVIVTDLDGKIEYANPMAEELFKHGVESLVGQPFELPLREGEYIEIDTYRPGKEPGVGEMQTTKTKWLNKEAMLIMVRDITERKIAENSLAEKSKALQETTDQLSILATQDALTELPNRRYFTDAISRVISLAKRHGKKFALLMVDIDNFKWINDNLGHDIGDMVLKELAVLFKKSVRKEDVVARIGGDEFTIILNEINDYHDAIVVAQKIVNALRSPHHIKSIDVQSTVSIGITFYPLSADNTDALLKQADIAMYKAKSQGRGGVEVYSEEIKASYVAANEIEYALQFAIDKKEF
jgi:diguanylate cyclase (GGDEF)-like protein/PAS domain S-box-containing protein